MIVIEPEDQTRCDQKRRPAAIEAGYPTTTTLNSSQTKAKRRRHSQYGANAAFWDSLSKVWLTRRALDELNRRNRERTKAVRPAVVRNLDPKDATRLLRNPSLQLKLFAKHGGPDLRDLAGVSQTREESRLLLKMFLQYPEPSALDAANPRHAIQWAQF